MDRAKATASFHHTLLIAGDVRNVLLTLARIWSTIVTEAIRSKPAAAEWVMKRLPEKYRPVMERARAICIGDAQEHWDDIQNLVKPCANFIVREVENQIAVSQNVVDGSIKIAEDGHLREDV